MNDGNDHVVVKNGQRVSGTMSEAEANAEADRQRKQITERQGDKVQAEQQVQVKRNLCG